MDGGDGGDDIVTGGGGDIIEGGAGADTLKGGTGDDTYLFALGDGIDTINNTGESASDDVVIFDSTIDHNRFRFWRTSNDLWVGVIGTNEGIVVQDWFVGTGNRVDFKTHDGYSLRDANVQALIDAMASLEPPVIGETELVVGATGYDFTAITGTIAGNWRSG